MSNLKSGFPQSHEFIVRKCLFRRWSSSTQELRNSCVLSSVSDPTLVSSGANLKGVDMEGSQMTGINLRVATLKNAKLKNCNLRGATLAGTDLEVSAGRQKGLSLKMFALSQRGVVAQTEKAGDKEREKKGSNREEQDKLVHLLCFINWFNDDGSVEFL